MTCRWTIEDTINGLEGMILSTKFIEHDFNGVVNIEACEQAIDLLKAQEQDSKKIIEKGNVYECPWCGEEVFSDTNPNYCGYCGKPVKWE